MSKVRLRDARLFHFVRGGTGFRVQLFTAVLWSLCKPLLGRLSWDIVWTFCKILYIFPTFHVLDLEYIHFISNALCLSELSLLIGLPRVISLKLGSYRPSSELGFCGFWKEQMKYKPEGIEYFADTKGTDLCAMQSYRSFMRKVKVICVDFILAHLMWIGVTLGKIDKRKNIQVAHSKGPPKQWLGIGTH